MSSTSNRRISPTADRDLALFALLITVVAGISALIALAVFGATVTVWTLGGGWHVPPMGQWFDVLGVAFAEADPGQARSRWAGVLRRNTGLYWVLTIALIALAGAAVTTVALRGWRRFGPGKPGHASHRDIHQHLSEHAARTAAAWTRPGLTAAERRRAPVEDIAVPAHRGPDRQPMFTTLENPTGTIAPTRSGKTRTDLVHKALAAPGALLCSTTKPDLFEFTAHARARRDNAGPVLVADATGSVHWPARVRWSPITGCHNPEVALRRADTLVEASAVGLARVAGNDKVFRERAKTVLQAYLLAAALTGGDIGHLVGWAITKPPEAEPIDILRAHGHTEQAANLRAEIGMVAETSDAVWMSVRRVIEPFMDARLRHLATPRSTEAFDADQFLHEQGTLFLIAGEHQAPQARPVLTALAEHMLTTAKDTALAQPTRRLDPPFTAVLDELYDATPIPKLPGIIADSAGRGVLIHWAAQSWAQLEDLYDTPGQRQLLDNTLTLAIFGGLKDQRTLEWASVIAGQHERSKHQQYNDGILGAGRSSIATETVPTYRPGDIRTLPDKRVLIVHRNLRPVLARTLDVKQRRDWTQLRADTTAIRAGTASVDNAGRYLSTT